MLSNANRETKNATFLERFNAMELVPNSQCRLSEKALRSNFSDFSCIFFVFISALLKYIERYKKALSYFERANELNYQLKTLSKLGAIYCYSNIDSAYIYTNRAIELSKELNDSTFLFENYEILSRAYWVDSQYTKQKEIDLYNIKHGSRFIS